jgi:hypothetical protein
MFADDSTKEISKNNFGGVKAYGILSQGIYGNYLLNLYLIWLVRQYIPWQWLMLLFSKELSRRVSRFEHRFSNVKGTLWIKADHLEDIGSIILLS